MNSSSSERGGAQMPNARPYSSIDIPEVINRNSAARNIVAGFATAAPTLSPAWQAIQTALADARDLAAEVARLSAELAAARLDRANALAAMRAAIARTRDGEADPLYYLRDELNAPLRTPLRAAKGATMTSYRRMRRQARQIRRSGMQPMMFINAGDQFPDPAGMLWLGGRGATAPNSPPLVRCRRCGAGWWLHARLPHGGDSFSLASGDRVARS